MKAYLQCYNKAIVLQGEIVKLCGDKDLSEIFLAYTANIEVANAVCYKMLCGFSKLTASFGRRVPAQPKVSIYTNVKRIRFLRLYAFTAWTEHCTIIPASLGERTQD